jgi:hypothetical protein
MGWESTRVDSDVYRRKCRKEDGTSYHELLLVYVDDCMAVSHDPKAIMESISGEYELKDGTYGEPETYLGSGIECFMLPNGQRC